MQLEERVREINETMEENKQCRESDDEDQCARNVFASCRQPTRAPPPCATGDCASGSGSSSGSGSGSGSDFQDDTEDGPTDISFEEQTTANSDRNNNNDNQNNNNNNNNNNKNGNKPNRITFSNHFNDAPAPVFVNRPTTTEKSSPTDSYGEGTVEVINITPGRGDDGEEEEDSETDATPTRTRIQQKPGKTEEPKDIDGKSGSQAVLYVVPTVVFTVLVSTLALLSF